MSGRTELSGGLLMLEAVVELGGQRQPVNNRQERGVGNLSVDKSFRSLDEKEGKKGEPVGKGRKGRTGGDSARLLPPGSSQELPEEGEGEASI